MVRGWLRKPLQCNTSAVHLRMHHQLEQAGLTWKYRQFMNHRISEGGENLSEKTSEMDFFLISNLRWRMGI